MHSIDELFTIAVDGDDDERLSAIQRLRKMGGAEVFDRAVRMCGAPEPRRRAAGAEILGQLPESMSQAVAVLEPMTGDSDPDVAAAAVLALAQQQESIEPMIALATHPEGKVRWALVTALESSVGDERAERVLLSLMRDDDVDVRDRATFAIGCLSETDSPRVRSALA
ncbi:MAG: HEAT repeat domain-containing protein, partial [Thermoanaerobaculia bacterium]